MCCIVVLCLSSFPTVSLCISVVILCSLVIVLCLFVVVLCVFVVADFAPRNMTTHWVHTQRHTQYKYNRGSVCQWKGSWLGGGRLYSWWLFPVWVGLHNTISVCMCVSVCWGVFPRLTLTQPAVLWLCSNTHSVLFMFAFVCWPLTSNGSRDIISSVTTTKQTSCDHFNINSRCKHIYWRTVLLYCYILVLVYLNILILL